MSRTKTLLLTLFVLIAPNGLSAQESEIQPPTAPQNQTGEQSPPAGVSYDDQEKSKPISTSREESTDGEWRHPVALGLTDDESSLLVLCRRTASLIVLPLNDPSKKHSLSLGGFPESMVKLADGRWCIADSDRNQLHLVKWDGDSVVIENSIRVGDEPKQLIASQRSPIVWVSLRTGHAVEAIDSSTGQMLFHQSLDFAPHCLAMDQEEQTLLVADAFRGRIAALNPANGQLLITRTFPGTNIRGLCFSADGQAIYFTNQIISERSIIERESVRWGAFITNNSRRIARDKFFDPSNDIAAKSELGFLGDFGNGAGDPGKLVMPRNDLTMVCFSGTNEVGIDNSWPFRFRRIRVGRRPVDIIITRSGDRAYVANMFDDSISIINTSTGGVTGSLSLGPLPSETAEMRGEILFHDASLSLDSWYSCQSCHTDGQSNGSNSDTLSDGSFGAPKNTPSLLGVAHTKPWSWVGRFESIEDQVESTLENTMQSRRVIRSNIDDLSAYLRTLEPRKRHFSDNDLAKQMEGRRIFERVGCAECHAGDRLTTSATFNVEIDDGRGGHKEFNPPSLLGVSQTAPYFHDGRAATLEEVIGTYKHRLKSALVEDDQESLLVYLRSL